jgi:hypothetical protein
MRRWLVGMASVALAACGSGSGSGGGGSHAVAGTIGGQAFTPAEVSAVVAGPATCTVQTNTVDVKAFAIRLASFTGVCADLASDPLCKLDASSRSVTLVFADIGVAGTAPALGAGTFQVDPNPANAQVVTSGPLAGTLYASFATAVETGATCPAGTVGQVAKGTLTIGSVDAATVTGSLDLTFGTVDQAFAFTPGTDTLKGDFTATVCAEAIGDLCSIATTGGQCSSPHC